jgi:uncharacterized membrane protein
MLPIAAGLGLLPLSQVLAWAIGQWGTFLKPLLHPLILGSVKVTLTLGLFKV